MMRVEFPPSPFFSFRMCGLAFFGGNDVTRTRSIGRTDCTYRLSAVAKSFYVQYGEW